jgi:hypothetical protein
MKIKTLLLFCMIISVSSCIDDQIDSTFTCEKTGRYLGDFPLTPQTDSLLPFEAGKSLVFVDSLGNEFVFKEVDVFQETVEDRTVRTVCGQSWLDVHEFDYYRHHEKSGYYYCNQINSYISLGAFKTYAEITDNSFITYDWLTFLAGWNYMYIGFPEVGRDKSDIPSYLWKDYTTQTIGDTTILGRPFSDVFKSSNSELYYNAEVGFVGFRNHDNVFYAFDRFE